MMSLMKMRGALDIIIRHQSEGWSEMAIANLHLI